jgi:muramidase (phage lysozyme)
VRSLPEIVQASEWPNVRAFWFILCYGETNDKDDDNDESYRALYGWKPGSGKLFASFADHPRVKFPLPDGEFTTAAGKCQITASSWDDFIKACGPKPPQAPPEG